MRAGLLWLNREGLGIWDLSLADRWPSPPQSSTGESDDSRLPRTLGLTTASRATSYEWLLRAGAFTLSQQPAAAEGGDAYAFHGNDLRRYYVVGCVDAQGCHLGCGCVPRGQP